MKNILLLSLLLLVGCSGGYEALKQASEGGLTCPAKITSAVNQSRVFENEYKKQNRKVIFQSSLPQSNLPKDFELSVLLDLKCISEKTNLSFLTQQFKNLPKRDFSKFSKVEAYTVKLPTEMAVSALEAVAEQDDCVVGVTQETYIEPQGQPNDPRYDDQSYLKTIRYNEIYDDVFTSSNKLIGEYIVGVIDTGYVITHPDLQNQWWVNEDEIPGNGMDDDNNGVIDDIHGANQNAIPPTGDPTSINYGQHGIHVSGLIAAETNNNEGIAGPMGPNVKILAINAWPSLVGPGNGGNEPMSVIDRSIRYAVDNGARVINISMQGEGLNPNIEDAMNYAAQRNVIVVVAAGNQAQEIGPRIGIPAYYTKDIAGAISVAATNSANGNLAPEKCVFSNFSSSHIEIGAPGCDSNTPTTYGGLGVLSCVPTTTDPSGYGYIQGTSMASPITAAGAIYTYALLKELAGLNPTAALVEEVLTVGSTVNPQMAGLTLNSKHLNLKSIYDYIQTTYVNPPGSPGNPCQ